MRDGPEEVVWLYEVGEGAYRDVAGRQEGNEPDGYSCQALRQYSYDTINVGHK